jgi:hypothetical protein
MARRSELDIAAQPWRPRPASLRRRNHRRAGVTLRRPQRPPRSRCPKFVYVFRTRVIVLGRESSYLNYDSLSLSESVRPAREFRRPPTLHRSRFSGAEPADYKPSWRPSARGPEVDEAPPAGQRVGLVTALDRLPGPLLVAHVGPPASEIFGAGGEPAVGSLRASDP